MRKVNFAASVNEKTPHVDAADLVASVLITAIIADHTRY